MPPPPPAVDRASCQTARVLGSVGVNCLLQECTSPAVCAAASVARSSSGGSISGDYCAAPLALSLLDACCRQVQRVFAAAALVRWRDAAVLLPLCRGDPASCVPLGEAASSVRSLSHQARAAISAAPFLASRIGRACGPAPAPVRTSVESAQIFGWWSASISRECKVCSCPVIPEKAAQRRRHTAVQPVRVAVGSAAQAARVVWRF